MITRLLLAATAILPISANLEAGLWDSVKNTFVQSDKPKPPTIKILIAHDVEGVSLEVKGKYNIYDPYKNARIASRFVSKDYLMQPVAGGLKWGEEFPGVYQLLIVPDEPNITTLIDGIEYRGSIYVYDIGGTISVVNEVDIEDYLNSLLSVQVEKAPSKEALAAAVIAARTNAYHQATTAQNPYWHLDAQKIGYQGQGVTGRDNGLEDALASTRYMVMSRTGTYDKVVTPFPAQVITYGNTDKRSPNASLSLAEAEELANKGNDAAGILNKTFPNTSITLIHNATMPSHYVAERVK